MSKKAIITLVGLVVLVVLAFGTVKYGWFLPPGGLVGILATGNAGGLVPILVVISALVDSLNPCAFSVLLLTIAFLFSLGRSRKQILSAGGTYIFGIFFTYILIGLGVTQALALFGVPHFMAKIGAGVVIAWAVIDLLAEFVPNFPIKLKIPEGAHRPMANLMAKGTIPTAFVLGILVGLTEFPCTGGPYLFILGLLHDHAEAGVGALYLVLYNILFVLPLSVTLVIASDKEVIGKVETWKKNNNHAFRVTMGVVMLILGVLILQF